MAVYTLAATGNWNSAATWGGAGFPIAGDTANITGGFTLTVNVASACAIVDFTGFTGTLTVNNTLTVTGNITFVNGFTTNTTSGTPILAKTTGGTLTIPAAGFTWPYAINFTGATTYTLVGGDLTIGSTLSAITSGTATINGAGLVINVKSVTASTATLAGTTKIKFITSGGTWTGTIATTGGLEIAIDATVNPDLTLSSARYASGTLTYTSGNMGVQNLILVGLVTFVNISSITFNTLTVGEIGNINVLTADGDINCTTLTTAGRSAGFDNAQINSSSTNFNIYCANLNYTWGLQSATYTIVINATGAITPANTDGRTFLRLALVINTTGTVTANTVAIRLWSTATFPGSLTYIQGNITQTFNGAILAFQEPPFTCNTGNIEWSGVVISATEPSVGDFTLLSNLRVKNLDIGNGGNSGTCRLRNSGGDIYVLGSFGLLNSTIGVTVTGPATGTTATINMIGSGIISNTGNTNTNSGFSGLFVPLIIDTSGKYIIRSTVVNTGTVIFNNAFIKSGIFTLLRGKVEVDANTKLIAGSSGAPLNTSIFTNMHRIPFNTVYLLPTVSHTLNEFFCGKPGKYCRVFSTTTVNATINFTDSFEKFSRFCLPTNITIANRGQVKLLNSKGNRNNTNLGFTYFEGAQPYGIAQNNPIVYIPSPCYGISDNPADPVFF
jgi:hypothetical protein